MRTQKKINTPSNSERIAMPKKAIVILAEGFEEIEAVTVIDILRRAGVEVAIAGLDGNKIRGSRDISVETDTIFKGSEQNFDACILPGGGLGAANLAASKKVKMFINQMHADNKTIAAICASPAVVLAPAGILDNKSMTCYPGCESKLKNVRYKNEAVVIDNNLITSQGPATALAFALAITEKLCGKTTAQRIKKETLANLHYEQKSKPRVKYPGSKKKNRIIFHHTQQRLLIL